MKMNLMIFMIIMSQIFHIILKLIHQMMEMMVNVIKKRETIITIIMTNKIITRMIKSMIEEIIKDIKSIRKKCKMKLMQMQQREMEFMK